MPVPLRGHSHPTSAAIVMCSVRGTSAARLAPMSDAPEPRVSDVQQRLPRVRCQASLSTSRYGRVSYDAHLNNGIF